MKRAWATLAAFTAATGVLVIAAPVLADVKVGVDAWQQGDYARAIAQWRPLAQAGDADAQFNMGQAYKLGRGVQSDMSIAIDWYRKAAAQGHTRAEDNLGLLTFQQGDRAGAMPYLQKSAIRGEARAQYIVGTSLFNGDLVGKDWVRAYALMTRAASSGLTQATASLAQMDKYIPSADRQKGLALAAEMETQKQAGQLAFTPSTTTPPAVTPSPRPASGPVRTTDLPPSGAPRPTPTPTPVAPKPALAKAEPAPKPAPTPKATPPRTASVPAPSAGGWRVQLGAFSEDGRARSLWSSLRGKVSGLAAYQPYYVKGGPITRLQAGPLGSSGDAERLCSRLKAAGADCIPKKM